MRRLVLVLLLVLFAGSALSQPGMGGGQYAELFRFDATHSGAIDHGYPSATQAQMAITFERAVAGTYASETGSYTFTVNGSPSAKVDDGTWPSGLPGSQGNAWVLDGTDDSLTISDGSGGDDFDPGDDFTVMAVVTPSALPIANTGIIVKDASWRLYHYGTGTKLGVTDDGTTAVGHFSTVSANGTLAVGQTACIVATYNFVTDGTSEGAVYVDEFAAATNISMDGPANDSAGVFEIGALSVTEFAGKIHHAAYWDGVVATEAEARHMCRQWRGTVAANGEALTITSASPPAILIAPPESGTEPFLMDMPTNVLQIGKWATNATIGGTSPSATDNFVHRRSLETWAAGSPSGWTETSGGGTSDATQNTTTMAHGGSSAQLLCDGVNAIQLDSACKALSGSTAYWADAYAKTTAGTATAYVQLTECTDGACSVGCVTTTLWTGDPGANWQARGDTRTTGAGVNSGYVTVKMDTTSATAVFDAVSLYTGAWGKRSFCPGDTDATASCTAIVPSANGLIPANGKVTIGITASSPWAGTDIAADRYLISDGVPAANNTISTYVDSANDEPGLVVEDNAGAVKTVEPNVADWAADTEYAVRCRHDGAGNLSLYWNSAWRATMGGAGTGMRSAAQTETYLGSNGTVGADIEWGKILIQRGVQP